MMVVLISRGGYCTITTRYDRAAISDEALFARCLLEGFDEILALAGDPAPHAVPASFDAEASGTSTRSAAGS
jgi:5,10-methylenetetrahydrofolate reductase